MGSLSTQPLNNANLNNVKNNLVFRKKKKVCVSTAYLFLTHCILRFSNTIVHLNSAMRAHSLFFINCYLFFKLKKIKSIFDEEKKLEFTFFF